MAWHNVPLVGRTPIWTQLARFADCSLTVDGDEDGGVSELLLRLQLVLHVGRDLDEVLLPDPLPVPDEHHAPVGLRRRKSYCDTLDIWLSVMVTDCYCI